MDFNSITVPVVKGLSSAQIEKEAELFLQTLAPECLQSPQATPVLEIFENKLEALDFKALIGKNIKGLGGITDITHRFIQLPSSTYKRLEKADPQARFTVAHEFGHAYLHTKEQALGKFPFRNHLTFAQRSKIRAFEDPEWQANAFAASILMPFRTMRMLHQQDLMDPLHIMDVFNVSWSAANRRVLKLRELHWRKSP